MAAIPPTDKMNFRTQLVDGKPQIFFEPIDNSATRAKSKRNSRAINTISRQSEQKNKINNQKYPTEYETKRQPNRTEQPTNQKQVNEDNSKLGVYMTMDEIADLVNAVKENAKSDINTNHEPRAPSPPRQQYHEPKVPPVVPNLDLALDQPPAPLPPPPKISAQDEAALDKKRQKWMREKAEIERMKLEIEYDQLKHQLSPRYKKDSTSSQRSTFQYDFPPSNKQVPTITNVPIIPPPLPQSSKQNGHQYDMSTRNNEESSQDTYKTRLMEKKQVQWKQENAEKNQLWDPFGRSGAGAPKINENPPRTSQPPPPLPPPQTNATLPYRAPVSQPQPYDNSSSSILPSDRARVPAAMRTNIAFGNSRHQDDVDNVKEIERRQWLNDLHKQIEDNKRKKYGQQETERRQDFLRENVNPLVQEAANRHQQSSDISNHIGRDSNKFNQNNTSEKQTYAGSLLNQNTGGNIFGTDYDASHLNVGSNQQQAYRQIDARRDEAVNTVDATFRSDHGIQTDLRIPPNRRMPSNGYDDSDLPPQAPNHNRNKKPTRVNSVDDNRQTPGSNSNNVGRKSQMNGNRPNSDAIDTQQRPIWNYNKEKRGEYVPNSKRDPNYETRQRLKQLQLGNYDCVDDVQKKTCYNRWNSDGDIQQKKQGQMNRTRSTVPKTTSYGNHKDESIMNLLKGQNKQQSQQQEAYGTKYPSSNHTKTDDDYNSNRVSSLDRYDNYAPYTQSDDVNESNKIYSQPIETTSQKQISEPTTNGNYQQREWDNTNRQYPVAQTPQYSAPTTKQEHILQQLSTIKENLIRRQRELASPLNVAPV
ncbi:unnamed protein product [Adineta steineri]|uniref:Uncharacterized protein n=1 Tax=Adineta steineri TaxID=433720 RepID=A0A818JCT7_9BILA|nr:unnamed protein product [Adineta steineri]CAF3537264.1 unnamed protein product [Adineta steineri]